MADASAVRFWGVLTEEVFARPLRRQPPTDIFSSDFAIPKWGSFKGFNDRMFYGTKENALKWAGRFDRLTGERNIWVSLRYVRWGV